MNRGLVVLFVVACLTRSPSADGRCVRGEVAVHRYGQADLVLVPETRCLLWTPFPDDVVVVDHDSNEERPPVPVPVGTPTGVRVKVYVPL